MIDNTLIRADLDRVAEEVRHGDAARAHGHGLPERPLDQLRDGERGEQQRDEARVPERPEGDQLHQDRRDAGREDADERDDHERRAEIGGREHRVPRDRHQLAVGEIQHPHHAVDHRQAEREQGIDAPERQRVHELLDELRRGHPGCPIPR
jgi:hypothetical protein